MMGVVARPLGAPGGGAPAVLLSQPAPAEEHSGRFELPPCGGLVPQGEGAALSLQPGVDYALRVEVLGPDGQPQSEPPASQQQPVKGGRKQGRSSSASSKGGRAKGGSKRKRRGAEEDADGGDGGDGAGPSGGAGAEGQQHDAIPPVTLHFVHVLPPAQQQQEQRQPVAPVPDEAVAAEDDACPADMAEGAEGPERLAGVEEAADAGGDQPDGGEKAAAAAAALEPVGAAVAAVPPGAGGEGVPERNQQPLQLQQEHQEEQQVVPEPGWREQQQQQVEQVQVHELEEQDQALPERAEDEWTANTALQSGASGPSSTASAQRSAQTAEGARVALDGEVWDQLHLDAHNELQEEPVHVRVRQPVVPTELRLADEVALPPGGRITLSNPAGGPAA